MRTKNSARAFVSSPSLGIAGLRDLTLEEMQGAIGGVARQPSFVVAPPGAPGAPLGGGGETNPPGTIDNPLDGLKV